jgi:hypothetical protein
MAAALVAQVLEDIFPAYAEDHFLEAALFAWAEGNVLDAPALVARVVRVHGVEVAGKEGRLVAAGAGAYFDNDAVKVLAGIDEEKFFQRSWSICCRVRRDASSSWA